MLDHWNKNELIELCKVKEDAIDVRNSLLCDYRELVLTKDYTIRAYEKIVDDLNEKITRYKMLLGETMPPDEPQERSALFQRIADIAIPMGGN